VQWGAKTLFVTGQRKDTQEAEAMQGKLYEEVGRLKMELDRIKKTAGLGGRQTAVDCPGTSAAAYSTAM
jgi:hypothetical protein